MLKCHFVSCSIFFKREMFRELNLSTLRSSSVQDGPHGQDVIICSMVCVSAPHGHSAFGA